MADDETGANPTIAQRLLDGWVKPASGVATTIISAVAAFFAFQGDQKAAEATARADEIKEQLAIQAAEIEGRKVNNDYNLKIIERVFTSIETRDVAQQELLVAIVNSISDEQLRINLLSAVNSSGAGAGRAEAATQLGAADFLRTISGPTSVAAASPTSISVSTPSEVPLARTQVLTRGRTTGGGYDVDVFWCQGGPPEAQQRRYSRAGSVAQALAAAANAGSSAPRLGRIRLRPLPVLVNARDSYGIRTDEVRFEPSEKTEGLALLRQVSAVVSGVNENEQSRATPTPYYLSVFFCAG